jgi:hypothetical protein
LLFLNRICEEEEVEEGHEPRIHASDQYYQENARPAREKCSDQQKYDIDEYWCAMHVLQTQYTLQIVRCNSIECCGPWRSNYVEVFPHRFLPSPVPFERTAFGIRMADKDCQKGQFYGSLFQRIQFHGVVIQHTQVIKNIFNPSENRSTQEFSLNRIKLSALMSARELNNSTTATTNDLWVSAIERGELRTSFSLIL